MSFPLVKDILREIRNSLSRYLSIIVIIALGVSFFVGIRSTPGNMIDTVDDYFDKQNTMDFQLISTYGLDKEDLTALEKLEYVEGIMPAYSLDVFVRNNEDASAIARMHSLPLDASDENKNYLNRPVLVEGRMPQTSEECLMDAGSILNESFEIGDSITLHTQGQDDDLSEFLKHDTFTVVGKAISPYYISFNRGQTDIGTGNVNLFLLVPEDAFSMEVYTEAYITVSGVEDKTTFTDPYEQQIARIKEQLEPDANIIGKARYKRVVEEAQTEIDDAQIEVDDGRKKLNDGIAKGKRELNKLEEDYTEKFGIYNTSVETFNTSIEKGQKEIDALKPTLEEAKTGKTTLEESIQKIKDSLPEGVPVPPEIEAQLNELQTKLDSLNGSITELENGIKNGQETLDTQKKEGQIELDTAKEGLNTYRTEIDNGWKALDKQKRDGEKKLSEAEEKITDAKKELSELEMPEWYILERTDNADMLSFKQNAIRLAAIGEVFPLIFFLVAAMVVLTTMTRMVEEQRTEMGTLKALGYSSLAISSKFFIYSMSATIVGIIAGAVIGAWLFPTVIYDAYLMMYTTPNILLSIDVNSLLFACILSVLSSGVASLAACLNALRSNSAELMRPEAPKAGKRVLLERVGFLWKRLSFFWKVTARNIFRYKKRLWMTLLGVAGATALLLTGFGLHDSIVEVVPLQYDKVELFQGMVHLNQNSDQASIEEFMHVIKDDDRISDYLVTSMEGMDTGVPGNMTSVVSYVMCAQDSEKQQDYIHFATRKGEAVPFTDEGAVITERLSQLFDVTEGGTIYVLLDNVEYEIHVTGVIENYVSHYIYMTPTYYESVFEKQSDPKVLCLKTVEQTVDFEKKLSSDLLKNDAVINVSFTTKLREDFGDMIDALKYVVWVLIVSAATLAVVVLYNLNSINITERLRELATLKVMGFYDREVTSYVFRESSLLTIMGVILGLFAGVLLHRFVIDTVSIEMIMFSQKINILSFVYSALITFGFAWIVSWMISFRLKKIDMVEALKSVE